LGGANQLQELLAVFGFHNFIALSKEHGSSSLFVE
jgi:hypothetical protein